MRSSPTPHEAHQAVLDFALPLRTPRTLSSYHVSSPATTLPEALAGEKRARSQEAAIFRLFYGLDGEHLTPSEVANKVNRGRERPWPLTSIRRALTNMTKRGLLVHHPYDRRPGPYVALESTWSLL